MHRQCAKRYDETAVLEWGCVHGQTRRAPCCQCTELPSLMPALPVLSRECNNRSCNVFGMPGVRPVKLR